MIIRPMTPPDVDFAFECAHAEGWLSETREVFAGFLAHDPAGCFVAEHEARRIGTCVATRYGRNGFLGELIVVPDMRGRGYGRRLLEHAIRYLHDRGVDSIFLDGDLEAVPLYERVGFRKVCQSLRFVGKVAGQRHRQVRKVAAQDVEALWRIDRSLFGDDRGFFLERRLSLHPDLCFAYQVGGEIRGYIMAQPGIGVVSVGPWAVLEGVEHPEALLERLALETGDEALRIGVLETNGEAVAAIQSLPTLAPQTPCWRMVLGPSEELGAHGGLYAIASAATG